MPMFRLQDCSLHQGRDEDYSPVVEMLALFFIKQNWLENQENITPCSNKFVSVCKKAQHEPLFYKKLTVFVFYHFLDYKPLLEGPL